MTKDMKRIKIFFIKKRVIASIVVVAILGSVIIWSIKASTFSISLEIEQGNRTSEVSIGSEKNASGGSFVLFGTKQNSDDISSSKPCGATAPPAKWNHVVVLIFENKKYSEVITSKNSPYIADLAKKCGTYANWKDADYKVNGQKDGSYSSKPNYATLTSGLSPSAHNIKDDDYVDTTSVDNIFNKLNSLGKMAKSYISTKNKIPNCANSGDQKGSYHDPMRFYSNLGGQSASTSTYCNTHDVPANTFLTDLNNGNLPALSIVIPTNDENTHDNSIPSGDAWAHNFLNPLFDSNAYKKGDIAFFFLWDEDTPIPSVFVAPSIIPGSSPVLKSGSNPFSHFSALKTWQEMLDAKPFLGESGQAPSLLDYYNGR